MGKPEHNDPSQAKFLKTLDKRRRLVRLWPLVGSLTLLALGALAVWLWFWNPYLINPLAVAEALEAQTMVPGTLALLAMFAPLLLLLVLLVSAILLLLGFAIMKRESDYLALIDALLMEREGA